ncbi:hypothetical protein [Actinomadura parmotrematis]|uniref:Esterase-like activity of phytase family protein n=1 Tax=Actinomadura parmotrematis TaxID=2864039 RepID=A0ABS7FPB1_9ACTN|nr:hypothetical protein [Actinomadura parmotrematis]MBW8481614.1 hypothetical protein [Actinomadura parmotrematis]
MSICRYRLTAGGGAAALVLAAAAPAAAGAPSPTPAPAAVGKASPKTVFRSAVGAPAALAPGVTHPEVWWTFETGRNRLYALGQDGRVAGTYTLPAAARLSALAVVKGTDGKGTLVFGDMEGTKDALTLYRAPEPARLGTGTVAARAYRVGYPDGAHNGGVLMADPAEGRVYAVTHGSSAAGVYALPAALGRNLDNRMTKIRRLTFGVLGGAFTGDGRVVLRTSADVRILGDVRDRVTHVLRVPGQAAVWGSGFGLSADGRRALLADGGARPRVRSVALPGAPAERPQSGASQPIAERTAGDTEPLPAESGLPGGLLGTGALCGLLLLGVLGLVAYLRGRRQRG